MAKLGIAVAGAVAGFFLGGPLGAQIGFTLGGVLGGVLFPGKLPPGPRVNDLIVSTATDGAPIPFGYGQQRIAGNVIWAPPIKESSTTKSAKGGPKQTTYTYTASFAVAFCEGPATIGRIWFDSKVVFDSRAVLVNPGSSLLGILNPPLPTYEIQAPITGSSNVGNQVLVQCTLNPPVQSQITISGAPQGNGTFQVITTTPTQFSYYNPNGVAPGSSGTASLPPIKYPAPVIYPGTETQQADPTVQAFVNAANCPAFRGLCYAVWTNFPLNDFGNRIPNVRAEVNFGTVSVGSDSPAIDQTKTGVLKDGTPDVGGVLPVVWNPNLPQEYVIAQLTSNSGMAASPGNTIPGSVYSGCLLSPLPASGPATVQYSWNNSGGALVAFSLSTSDGNAPNVAQQNNSSVLGSLSFASPVPAGHMIVVFFGGGAAVGGGGFTVNVTDDKGNNYKNIGFSRIQIGLGSFEAGLWVLQNPTNSPQTIIMSSQGASFTPVNFSIMDFSNPSAVGAITYTPNLAAIVRDICLRSGLTDSDIDLTQLLSSGSPAAAIAGPLGYVIGRPTAGQSALKPLAMAFFFDGAESSGKLRFVPRGGALSSLTIPESDLGLWKDNFKLVEQIIQQQDLPRDVQVLYLDKNIDYQQNKTHKIRHARVVKTRQESLMELPMVLDPALARQISEKALFLAYLERKPFDINLWKALYLLIDPTDVIQFTYEGLTFQMRVVKAALGVDYQSQLSGVNETLSAYLSSVGGSSGSGVIIGAAKTVPDTVLLLFDMPLLRDSDSNPAGSGYYFAMGVVGGASTWPGASLQKSSDNVSFAEDDHSGTAVNYGTALNTLGPLPKRGGGLGGLSPWTWDTVNTLTVFMNNGSLAGTSDFNVYNGANAMIVGGELIQYANAVQNADGSFTVSRLLRGRRGTELNCNNHGPSETVVDLNLPGLVRHQMSTSNLQVLRYFEAVTYGNNVDPAKSKQFIDLGQDLFPYAVTSVAGSRDGSGGLTATWVRRTRIGGEWLEGIGTVPLSEAAESYDVEVLNGQGAVVRTFSALPSPQVTYPAAQQTADFGSPLVAITLNIYQNSGAIGRGFKKTVTL